MTPDQIDTAIAEFRGWTEIRTVGSGRLYGYRPNSEGQAFRFTAVPQYHKCLNAMAEAEQGLSEKDLARYAQFIIGIARHSIAIPDHDGRYPVPFIIRATAPQRAESLLRTIGKWQGSPA